MIYSGIIKIAIKVALLTVRTSVDTWNSVRRSVSYFHATRLQVEESYRRGRTYEGSRSVRNLYKIQIEIFAR